jgi:hypothetical protein
MDTQIKTITINGVEYIEKSAVQVAPIDCSGMTYCIVRSRDQGVVCGYVDKPTEIVGRAVTVHAARQIWAWDSSFVLMDLAENGPRDVLKMRMSVALSAPFRMLEACGIYPCADSGTSLRAVQAVKK